MNRYKKEELKKRAEARKGRSPSEIEQLDKQEALENALHGEARKLHELIFPEEYDFMWDSGVDLKLRNQGGNPMSSEYIERIKTKRNDLGVPQLTENGMPKDDTTYKLCLAELIAEHEDKTTEWTEKLKKLKEQALDEKKKAEERIEDLQKPAPGINPADPHTWTETMIKNRYQAMVAADLWESNDSIAYEEFKEKLFTDDKFRMLHVPRKGMEKDDYNPWKIK
jgi:hypothetical protein